MKPRAVYAAVVVFVTILAGFIGNVLYTNHVERRAEHRNTQRAREICGLITVLDDAYTETPPTTPTGKRVADEIHTYRVKLGC